MAAWRCASRAAHGLALALLWGCVDFTQQTESAGLGSVDSTSDAPEDTDSPPVDSGLDTGTPVSDTGDSQGDTAEPEDEGLEPAGDYSQMGAFTPGSMEATVKGRTGATLYTDIWYPSSEMGAEHRYYGWESWGFDGESYTDVTPDCSEPRPVMVHSHGNTSIRWEMFYLPEFLSTHGWIVVAPDHAGNTFYDSSEDFVTLVERRPQDLSDAYNWLLAQSQIPGNRLYGCIDEAAGFVASGYSFGGYTALATAGALVNEGSAPVHDLSDERVWAVVSFAPWDAYGLLTAGTEEIQVPALTLGGERDATVGTQYMNLHSHIRSTPRLMGSFPNGGHFSFTPIYCSSWGDGCGTSFIEPEEFVPILRTSVLATLEHIRGRSGALEQLTPASDELSWALVE